MLIQTVKNLQNLIDRDKNIELIEIWAHCLYIRYRKGRNKFFSKKGITEETEGVYFNLRNYRNEYLQLISKYHPDRARSKSALYISQSCNQWKTLLSGCEQRSIDSRLSILNAIDDKTNFCFSLLSSTVGTSRQEATGLYNGYRKDTFNPITDEEALKLYNYAKESLEWVYNRTQKRNNN